jgi:hypothetical protein
VAVVDAYETKIDPRGVLKEFGLELPQDVEVRVWDSTADHWLVALERLVASKGLADPAALLERKEEWADAYRHTPHGKPVTLNSERLISTTAENP